MGNQNCLFLVGSLFYLHIVSVVVRVKEKRLDHDKYSMLRYFLIGNNLRIRNEIEFTTIISRSLCLVIFIIFMGKLR